MNWATSVHALTDWGQPVKSFRQVIAEAAEIGFTGLMLMHWPDGPTLTAATPDPPTPMLNLAHSDLRLVRRAVEEHGLHIACVYEALMHLGSEEEIQNTIKRLIALSHLAEALGVTLLLPNAGVAPRPQMPLAEKRALLQALARVLEEALRQIPSAMKIAPDIHYGAIVETVADCRALFRYLPDPRAGVTLNIGHMTTLGEPGWTLLEEAPERVHIIAWKDHRVPPPPPATHPVYSVELGTGQSPFAEYARRLPADGGLPLHLITFEHVPLAEKKDALQRSLAFMERLWAETH